MELFLRHYQLAVCSVKMCHCLAFRKRGMVHRATPGGRTRTRARASGADRHTARARARQITSASRGIKLHPMMAVLQAACGHQGVSSARWISRLPVIMNMPVGGAHPPVKLQNRRKRLNKLAGKSPTHPEVKFNCEIYHTK